MSAGEGTPLISRATLPLATTSTVESAQLEAMIRPSASTSTPSQAPGPRAITVGALSPDFHENTAGPPNDTTTKLEFAASHVIPFGRSRVSPCAATLTSRFAPTRKMRSGPGWLTLPVASIRIPVSVTYNAPSGPIARSFKNFAPSFARSTVATGAKFLNDLAVGPDEIGRAHV